MNAGLVVQNLSQQSICFGNVILYLHLEVDLFSVTLGDVTEIKTYTVNLIILLGERLIY